MKEKGPPCDTCFPGVHPLNQPAFVVYQRCQNQWIATEGGRLVAIRAEAIETALRVCRVPVKDRRELFDQVMAIGAMVAAQHNERLKASAKSR